MIFQNKKFDEFLYSKNNDDFGILEGCPLTLRRDFFNFFIVLYLLWKITRKCSYFMNSSVIHLKSHVNRKRKRNWENPSLVLLGMFCFKDFKAVFVFSVEKLIDFYCLLKCMKTWIKRFSLVSDKKLINFSKFIKNFNKKIYIPFL